ncbi:MAG: BrnA antitoxin family protein [Alphaproteobacteria bacterium]|nr:BrnA antitoxin family protein [Alphaproteobacteria bacterium]MBV9552317.1 BrnA antitoxin family protein [Alphaproteobacteria bacterium]
MRKRKPLIDDDGEVRELTAEDFKLFRPIEEVLSPELVEMIRARPRISQRAPVKERTTIRLSHDVLQRFRAGGRGWQARIDTILREWLDSHSAE